MNDTINQVGAGAPAPMKPQFTTVVIRDAKDPIQLGNLLLGGVISAAATGNLVEEQFQREAAAPAAPVEPVECPICGSDEPHTGTCGSRDPRALCNRAEAKPAPAAPVVHAEQVVMPTDAQLIEIARRFGALPELCNTEDHPDIRWRVNPEVRAMVREVLTLYAAPAAPVVQAEPVVTDAMREAAAKEMYRLGYGHHESDAESILIAAHAAHPDASVLVEALEKIKSDTLKDDPLGHYDVACGALKAYRAALAGKGGE